jgi:hypothetical protein
MRSNAQEHPRSIFRRVPKLAYACLLWVAALLYFLVWYPKSSYLSADVRMPPDAAIARLFACPSAQPSLKADDAHSQTHETDSSGQTPGAWIPTHAMNPNCSEDSPRDMVFLFE